MRKISLTLVLLTTAAMLSACSFSVGTGGSNASPTPANTAVAGEKKPAASPSATPAATPKADDSLAAAKSDKPKSGDSKSEEEKIQFKPGSSEAELERTIAPGVSKMYSFGAKKGQTFSLRVTDPTNELEVAFNKEDVAVNDNYSQVLNASGEWAIYVYNNTEKPIKYTLWLSIE